MTDIDNVPDWARPAHEATPDVPDWAKPAYSSERAPASRDPAPAAIPDWAEPATARAPAPAPAATPNVPDWARVAPPAADYTPIGDAAPDFGSGTVTPGEMDAAGKEFRRLGAIGAQAAGARALNLGAMLHEGMNPGETVAAKLTGVPTEYTPAGQVRQVAEQIAPHVDTNDRGGRFAEMIGGLAPDLAAAAATGGLAELPAGASIGARALHGAATMALPAAENTREAYDAARSNGLTPLQATEQAAVAGGGTLAMGAIPANIPGDLATRAVSGAAIAGLQTEGQRYLANALLPADRPDLQQPFDAFNLGAGVLTGGVMAGALGHDSAHDHPSTTAHPDSKVNAPGFESNPSSGNVFDQFHEPQGLMNPFDSAERRASAQEPAQSDYKPNLVADENGVLRAVPTQPEQPQATSEHPQPTAVPDWAQSAQAPHFPDPNVGPISRVAAQVTPAHRAEQSTLLPAPPFPDAEIGSLADAANAIAPFPFESPPRAGQQIDPNKTQHADDMPKGSEQAHQHAAQPAFRTEPLGSHGLLVHGDPDTVRQQLVAVGFAKRGRVQDGALRFDAKDRDAIEQALFPQQRNDEAISFPNVPAKDTQTPQADDVPPPIPDYGAETMYARAPRATTDDLLDSTSARERTTFADALDRFRAGAPQATPEQTARNARAESAIERDMARENQRKAQDSAELAGLQEQEHQEPTYVAAARRAWREQGTDSPFFRHWFGDSKVVDAQDKPRTVFHGTSEDFNVFRDDKLGGNTGHMTAPLGHFLTESRAEAQRYAEKAANGVPADERVIKSYLSIKHPAVMTKDQFLAVDSQDAARSLRQWLERHGHDGIRLDLGNGKTQWIAFDSGQIKDVNNRGTFDRNNPDIRYARRGASESGTPLTKEEVSAHASRIVGALPGEGVDADRRVPIRVVDSFEKLPDAPRKMAEAEGVRNGDIKALHVGGRSYLLADQMHTPADVQEAIFHEHYTHGGLRAKYGTELGPKLDNLLHGVGGVDGVRRLAERQGIDLSGYEKAVAENPKLTEQNRQRVLMEELLAHMSKMTGTLKRTVQEWAGAMRDWLRRNGFADLAKYGETDLAHVLKQARAAANEKAGTESESRPFYQRSPDAQTQGGERQPAGGRDALSSDELREAQSIAKRGAFAKMFQFAKTGDQTIVSYNGKELARMSGAVNRKSLTAAIDARLQSHPPEATTAAPSAAASTPPVSAELPPRRPGEAQGAYARRVSAEHADDLRAATALKSEQKTIGRHAIREMLAKRSRAMDVADAVFGEYRKLFDKTDPAKNLEHVDEWETGKRVSDPDFRAFLAQMKTGFNERVQRLRELDPRALQHLITHYMPHVYKDPARAATLLKANVDVQAARHSIAGGKEFLEPRSWPTLKAAMRSGLEPITTNPVDWIMLRYASMDKLIGSLELRKELDTRGWLSKVKNDEEPLPGYKRVADPAFNGYALPEPIARDITNYLAPGFSKYAAWRTLRGMQNFMVAADLGFSGFHATFTSTDNVIMHTDVALRRAAIGDSRGAAATLVKALTSVVTSPFEGHKLNQQWRGIREADANTAAILDALERGGARWKMSTTEYQNAIPKLARMFRQMQGAGVGAHVKDKTPAQIAVGAIKVPLTALQAAAETGSYLIHHVLVPNQKMAARVLLYKYELDKRAQDLGRERGDYAGIVDAMNPDVVRQLAAQVNDIVDFRLGQMAYDNRFWPRVVQDVAQAAVMAPGWQFGMLQTVLGAGKAVKDLASPSKLVAPLDRAGKITDAHMGRVGSNLSYFLTLALTLGGGMASLQYLLTGQGPTQIKDLFFPKTGRKNDDDSDERLQLPNYWVDHYKLATEPGQTASNKIHPLWKMLWEVGHNKDYFGTRIRDPDAPALEQAQEVGKYLASKFVPITFGNMQKGQQRHETTAQQVGHFFGVNNAPARVARSDFQNFISQGGTRGWGDYTKTPEDAQRHQQMHAASAAIRRGEEPDFGSLGPADQVKARKDAKLPVPAMLFKSLSDVDKLRAYDIATPEEREQYGLHGVISRMKLEQSAPFKRMTPAEQAQVRQRLQAIRSGAQ